MNLHYNIAILILAAGSSSRMKKPKQLLKWKNSTLLGHTIETALKIETEAVYVVLGANQDVIENEISQYDVNIINNSNWSSGMGTSIACGVKYILRHQKLLDGILIMLADQPLIDSNYLETMISQFNTNKNQIIVSSYEKDKIGVPALFDTFYTKNLSNLEGDTGAKKVILDNNNHLVVLDAKHLIKDIDTFDDYKYLYSINH